MRDVICFDMDGTLADLYHVPFWLDKLRAGDASPYYEAKPLHDMKRLNEVCSLLKKAGYEIQIITAMSKDATPEYKKAIREAKLAWLDKWGFVYDHFHGVDYKTNKREVIRRDLRKERGTAFLVDDEARHTEKWGWGPAINPDDYLIEKLEALLPEELEGGV